MSNLKCPSQRGAFVIYRADNGYATSMLGDKAYATIQEIIDETTRVNQKNERRASDPQALHVVYVAHDQDVSIHIIPALFVGPEIMKMLSTKSGPFTIHDDYGFSTQARFSKDSEGAVVETYYGLAKWPDERGFTPIKVSARNGSADGPISEIDAVTRQARDVTNTIIAEIASIQLRRAVELGLLEKATIQ
jgi:hypothetical protein